MASPTPREAPAGNSNRKIVGKEKANSSLNLNSLKTNDAAVAAIKTSSGDRLKTSAEPPTSSDRCRTSSGGKPKIKGATMKDKRRTNSAVRGNNSDKSKKMGADLIRSVRLRNSRGARLTSKDDCWISGVKMMSSKEETRNSCALSSNNVRGTCNEGRVRISVAWPNSNG